MGNRYKSEFIKNLKLSKPNSMEYIEILSTDKDKVKFIKTVENIVRQSLEYRDYISFLKENIGLDKCVFFQNIGGKNSSKRISIEIHHDPLTLYDIVLIVLNKYKDQGLPINDIDIAEEVMELHYENKVGLVPLSKTMHEVVHNSTKVFVPLTMVYGQYSDFIKEYEPYIPNEIILKIEKKLTMTENLTPEDFDAIRREFTYLEVENVDEVEKMDLKKAIMIA